MELSCISWNVRGLETHDRKYIIKSLLKQHPMLNVALLHEVKAIGFTLDIWMKCIQKDVIPFSTKQ